MIWLTARDANAIAEERGLPVRFQALLPMQLMADTPLGKAVAAEYAQRRGISVEAHVAERYGTAIAGLAQHVLSRITSRPRPYVQDCADDGKSTSHTCGDTRDNRSLWLWAPTFSAVDDGGIVAIRAVF